MNHCLTLAAAQGIYVAGFAVAFICGFVAGYALAKMQ
jgi:hypothetical protein